MDADPQVVLLVLEEIDVVVSAADGSQLLAGELRKFPLWLERCLFDSLEHRMVDVPAARSPDAEADRSRDLVHGSSDVDFARARGSAHGLVATGDVVADAARRDVIGIC